ncbi:hypothetical protein J2S09_002309 [Bacillus fengqiuensis]|nr:hypothetical protein [Bacillus fengqiuensis]
MSFKEIESKLSEFEIKKYSKRKHHKDEIETIEVEYKVEFPEDFKLFLLQYGTCTFNEDDIYYRSIEKNPWTPDDGFESVEIFYGLDKDEYDIRQMIQRYSEYIPGNLIPFAESPGGNQICIAVNGNEKGKIYFWDHENRNGQKDLFLVAESFSDFINSFQRYQRDLPDIDDVEIWLDDDLLND